MKHNKLEMTRKLCPGCGCTLDQIDGPTHAYMYSTPACWKIFNNLLAAEYESAALMEVHHLSVDAYAVQHPGNGSRQAIQSVGLHLARLAMQYENPHPLEKTKKAMQHFANRKETLIELDPPKSFTMTIADVAPFTGKTLHADKVKLWARSTWNDWQAHHAYILDWISGGESR